MSGQGLGRGRGGGGPGGHNQSWPPTPYSPQWANYVVPFFELLLQHILSQQRGYRVLSLSQADREEGVRLLMELVGFPGGPVPH